MEDMAGMSGSGARFMEAYRGTSKINPRGPVSAQTDLSGRELKSRFKSLRTTRGANVPNYSCNDLGFRIVCECDL
jgi:hypothetical protein